MELAGLEPATSWVRLARSPFGTDRLGLLRSRWLRQVRSDALSSVARLVSRALALRTTFSSGRVAGHSSPRASATASSRVSRDPASHSRFEPLREALARQLLRHLGGKATQTGIERVARFPHQSSMPPRAAVPPIAGSLCTRMLPRAISASTANDRD